MIKVERYVESRNEWVRVAEFPDDQREVAEAYAQDRQHATQRRYRVN